MGTRKISQLETIDDANLSGEAILPVVVSDPLIPNRKVKVNQLHKGVAQGVKNAPGLCFDLDRDTGLYQTQYDEIGLGFGDGGIEFSRSVIDVTSTLTINAVDETATNSNIRLSPKGTGVVQVAGGFRIADGDFELEDAQGPRVKFEVGLVGSGTSLRTMTFPSISAGSGTTLVGADTQQTLTNKTLLIDEDNLVIVDGSEEASFQINWALSSGIRRSYFLPDAGTVTTTAEPTATASTLLDTKSTQTILNKTIVDPRFATDSEADTSYVIINTDSLTDNRTITVPDLSLTLVGLDTTQSLTNKTIENLILNDSGDITKRATFSTANQNTTTNRVFEFPATDDLNTTISDNNTLVTTLATQKLSNKELVQPSISDTVSSAFSVTIRADNITGDRVIRFPDSDATLLSTENVTAEDVNFGAGIGGQTLTGRTRQQQFFYAGF